MKLDITVEFEGGEKRTVRVRPVTQIAFEREHSCGLAVVGTEQKLSHLYWLAWHADTLGNTPFDDWIGRVEALEVDAGEATPFEGGASEGG